MRKKGRTLTEKEIEEVVRLYDEEGIKGKEIAKRFEVSYPYIQRFIRTYAKTYKVNSNYKNEITFLLIGPNNLEVVEKIGSAELRKRLGVSGSHPLTGYSKCDGLLIAEE